MIRKSVLKTLETLREEFEIIDMKEIKGGSKPFINTKTYQCILKNGKIVSREKIQKGNRNGDAVTIVPLTDALETILVVQPRVFTKTGIGVEVPAGYVDDLETPEDAALRELREETGFVPKKLIHLTDYYQDQGCSAAYIHCYLAIGCEKVYEQKLDKDEYINYLDCHFKEVVEMVNTGIINDANSIIAINEAKKVLKRKTKEEV